MGLNFLKIDQDFKVENCNADNIDNILKELYKRIIIPLYIPVLILISLLLIFKSKENINYPRYRILIFLIGFSTIILSEMTIRLIKEDFLENLKFVLIPLILIISLYSNYLVRFKKIKA
jgi:lipopolysaccharide export system permease protein